jgi:hypothetical protein
LQVKFASLDWSLPTPAGIVYRRDTDTLGQWGTLKIALDRGCVASYGQNLGKTCSFIHLTRALISQDLVRDNAVFFRGQGNHLSTGHRFKDLQNDKIAA